jgi:DNA (cytosine-5)-methyltransferase 1
MSRKILVADLLCGAGGSSTGCARALAELGLRMELVCVNHWPIAIETHTKNHPEARHYCQDISTVRPHMIVPEGYLDLLMASPTCTHHSVARGGKPTSDQQRSDPWHILTWFTELRVKRAIIENVWEYTGWGPVDHRTKRPIKSRKGEFHAAWIDAIWKLGATSIDWRKINSANYGAATTRSRYICKIRFDRVAIGWAPITHHKRETGKLALFPGIKPWRAARDIIDWDIRGRSIFGRPVSLAPKTLARILAGATKFEWPRPVRIRIARELELSLRQNIRKAYGLRHAKKAKVRDLARKKLCEYIAWLRHIGVVPEGDMASGRTPPSMLVVLRRNADGRSITRPLPALAAGGQHFGLAEPIIFNGRKGNIAKPVSADPVPTLDTKGGVWLAEPFVLSQASGGAPRSTQDPLPTAPTDGAHALIVPYYGSGSGETCSSTEEPLPTATAKARFAMIVPITHSQGHNRAHDPDEPLPTLTTAKRGELAFITAQFGEREGQAPRVHDIGEPAPGICATGHINLVEPAPEEMDCLYRMLVPHELAAAMGFNRDEFRYEFAGNKTEQIKQIGNAVSVEMMEAEVKAIMADAVPKARASTQSTSRPSAVA